MQRTIDAAAALGTARTFRSDLGAFGIERIELHEDRVGITVRECAMMNACGLSADEAHEAQEACITIGAPVARVRRGHELRLMIADEGHTDVQPVAPSRDPRLAALLTEAMDARALILGSPECTLERIASDHGKCRKRLARFIKLSWLAPDIVADIAHGRSDYLTASGLLDMELPIGWAAQRAALQTNL